jgi:hypothetical protein
MADSTAQKKLLVALSGEARPEQDACDNKQSLPSARHAPFEMHLMVLLISQRSSSKNGINGVQIIAYWVLPKRRLCNQFDLARFAR